MIFFKLSTILRRITWNNFSKVSQTMSTVGPILVNELPKSEEILQIKNDYVEGNSLKLILQVEEHLTETLWWPSKNNDENLILLVIPGNPGVIDYYNEFLNTVHDELEKKIDIVGGSYIKIISENIRNDFC